MGQERGFDGFAAVRPGGTAPAWTHVVTIGADVLFVRDDGVFAAGRIDRAWPVQELGAAFPLLCRDLARPCPRTCGCAERPTRHARGR